VSVLTIAKLTFQEARQRRLLHLILLLGAAFLLLFGVGFYLAHTQSRFSLVGERLEVTNFLLLTALYAANFLGVVLAVVLSVDTIAGEIASGAIHTVVTKPLRRWEVVAGKWLGLATLLTLITVAVTASMIGISYAIARYAPPNVMRGIALMVLAQLVVLTLSIVGGTRLNTLANGVFVFMAYGLAFIAGWIEQIGAVTRSEGAVDLGIVVSLLVPAEAVWRRASYVMQPPFLAQLGFGPFQIGSAPSAAMVVYAAVYVAAVLAVAIRLFQRRDL
jgi:ABC-type transport system involved in multi-copper enzyme maturation permease subunit